MSIELDREMAWIILGGLNAQHMEGLDGLPGHTPKFDFGGAGRRVVEAIRALYPDIFEAFANEPLGRAFHKKAD